MGRQKNFVLWLCLFLGGMAAYACDTPVFRYALERWSPSVYTLFVFHRGILTAEEQALTQVIEAAQRLPTGPLNFQVLRVDLAEKQPDEILAFWNRIGTNRLPWLALKYPDAEPDSPPAWSAPLNAAQVQALLDSPARRQIRQLMSENAAAVWLFLESGDPTKDESAAKVLSSELKKNERTLEWPASQDLDNPDATNTVQFKVRFPIVRLSRNAPSENFLTSLLLNRDQEVAALKEPIAIPVFGRGRALCALPGQQINSKFIAEVTSFLLGECSCEVKEQNPGFDLLLAANWDAMIQGAKLSEPPPPALPKLGGLTSTKTPTNNPAAISVANTASTPAETHWLNNVFYVIAALLAAIAIASFFVVRYKKNEG